MIVIIYTSFVVTSMIPFNMLMIHYVAKRFEMLNLSIKDLNKTIGKMTVKQLEVKLKEIIIDHQKAIGYVKFELLVLILAIGIFFKFNFQYRKKIRTCDEIFHFVSIIDHKLFYLSHIF